MVKLASFIQEEAGLESEDARVSACFHNRLESSDPQWAEHKLESNASSYIMQDSENNYLWNSPTAEYFGWPEQGAIPDDVLALYDTYAISGLPAGPISCPGYAAMEAALNPDEEYINEGTTSLSRAIPAPMWQGSTSTPRPPTSTTRTASRPGGRRNSPLALQRGHLPRRGRQELSLTIQIPKRPLPTGRFLRKTEESLCCNSRNCWPPRQPGNAEIRRHVRRGCRLLRPAGIWHARRTRQPDRGRAARGCIFAHARGKKVYLTLNTLPTNEELSKLPRYIQDAAEAGVDAFIIADLGVLALAKKYAPQVERHVSTQAGITNYEAAKVCYELGAKRVVLARELPLTEIALIRR